MSITVSNFVITGTSTTQGMGGITLPVTLSLKSSSATRKLEISTNGGLSYSPAPISSFDEDTLVSTIYTPITNFRATGEANDVLSAVNDSSISATATFAPVVPTVQDTTTKVIREAAKAWFKKKPLIRAAAWATGTAYTAGMKRRHSNGQLLQCATTGTSHGSTEPTFNATALMTDNTTAWVALGKKSMLATDEYDIPTVSFTGTIPTNAVLRTLFTASAPGPLFGGTIAGGTGYVDGTYLDVPLTGGAGTGAIASSITVASGIVTAVVIAGNLGTGTGYVYNNVLSADNTSLGGSGSGFTYTATSIINDPNPYVTQTGAKKEIVITNAYTNITFFDNGSNSSPAVQPTRTIEFITDDPTPAIRLNSSTARISMWVDGYKVEEDTTPFVSQNPAYVVTDWAGARKLRHYRVQFSASAGLRGIALLPQSVIYPVARTNLKFIYFGDSYNNTVYANAAISAPEAADLLAMEIPRRLGLLAARNMANGSTGYYTGKGAPDRNGSSTRFNCLAQLQNNDISDYSDAVLILFFIGLNDTGIGDQTQAATNALAAWQLARLKCPTARIAVSGIAPENGGPDATALSMEALIKAKFEEWNDSNSLFFPIANDPKGAWITGTGLWGTTTGTGNSDFFTGADGTHPSIPGREMYIDRITAILEADLQANGL